MFNIDDLVQRRNIASYQKHTLASEQERAEVALKELAKAKMKRYQKDLQETFTKMFGLKNKPLGGRM